jgi:hypothetical protein
MLVFVGTLIMQSGIIPTDPAHQALTEQIGMFVHLLNAATYTAQRAYLKSPGAQPDLASALAGVLPAILAAATAAQPPPAAATVTPAPTPTQGAAT